MSNMDIFYKALDQGISSIPCKKTLDSKKNVYTYKQPLVSWNKYTDTLVTEAEIESWSKSFEGRIFGMGYVIGEASNLACIDIDTEDVDLQNRIVELLNKNGMHSPCIIKGNPKRVGKYLYRLYDPARKDEFRMPQKSKHVIPNVGDIFYGTGYVCAPPSLHSETMDGRVINYEWDKNSIAIEDIDLDDLPIIDILIHEKIIGLTQGHSASNLNMDLSETEVRVPNTTGNISNRHGQMTNLASRIMKDSLEVDDAINELVSYDNKQFPGNSFFQDGEKGFRNNVIKKINAGKFLFDIMARTQSGKEAKYVEMPMSWKIESEFILNWPSTIQFSDEDGSVPPFNTDLIPNQIKDFILKGSIATSVPPQFIFFYFMTAFSSVIGNKCIISPYRNNIEYKEASNLFMLMIARSGARKSEIARIAKSPLVKLEHALRAENKRFLKQSKRRKDELKRVKKGYEIDLQKELETNKDIHAHNTFKDEIYAKIDEIDTEMGKLKTKNISLYEKKATPEALYEVLEDNNKGLFIERDEFGNLMNELSQADGSKMRDLLMQGWDGINQFKYKTKTQGENNIEKLNISMAISGQPDVVNKYMLNLKANGGENDGFIQRFMLIGSEDYDIKIVDTSFTTEESLVQMFRNAYETDTEYSVKLNDHLEFDNGIEISAYQTWIEYQKTIALRVKELDSEYGSYINKMSGISLRIASVLSHIKSNGNIVDKINLSAMKESIAICRWLEECAKIYYDSAKNTMYKELINQFITGSIEKNITLKQWKNHNRQYFKKESDVVMIMEKLSEHNYIRTSTSKHGTKIHFNPMAKGLA